MQQTLLELRTELFESLVVPVDVPDEFDGVVETHLEELLDREVASVDTQWTVTLGSRFRNAAHESSRISMVRAGLSSRSC